MNDTEILDTVVSKIEEDMLHPSTYVPGSDMSHDMGQCMALASVREDIINYRKRK